MLKTVISGRSRPWAGGGGLLALPAFFSFVISSFFTQNKGGTPGRDPKIHHWLYKIINETPIPHLVNAVFCTVLSYRLLQKIFTTQPDYCSSKILKELKLFVIQEVTISFTFSRNTSGKQYLQTCGFISSGVTLALLPSLHCSVLHINRKFSKTAVKKCLQTHSLGSNKIFPSDLHSLFSILYLFRPSLQSNLSTDGFFTSQLGNFLLTLSWLQTFFIDLFIPNGFHVHKHMRIHNFMKFLLREAQEVCSVFGMQLARMYSVAI